MTTHNDWSMRRSRASEAEAFVTIRAMPSTRRFQPIESITSTELARMLDERGAAPLTPTHAGKLQWTICHGDAPIGWVSLTVTSRSHHTGAVGYSIHPDFAGRGFTSRSLLEVIDIAFDPRQLALERLEAVAAVENAASRRVLEKCGFAVKVLPGAC